MSAAVKELLRNFLNNLSVADFKRFKLHLKDQGPIPWGKLEKADTDDIVESIVQVYTMEAIKDVMVAILQNMNLDQLAMDLETELGRFQDQTGSHGQTRGGGAVNMNVAAHSGGTVNASTFIGCNISGPFTINSEGTPTSGEHPNLQNTLSTLKLKMEKRVKYICEGIEKKKREKLLKQIYTNLYIVKGETEAVNNEHEIWQIEETSRPQITEDMTINCNDIFKSTVDKDIRAVLTMGVAGIGKTVSVQKFILDWVEGKANQHVDIMLMFTFRELNLLKVKYSLRDLLCDFYPELKQLPDTRLYHDYKTVIIFDGLDESRTHLDFHKEIVTSATQPASIDVLVTSIIRGKLLSSALVWITSRPAAVNQIPSEYIDQVTEVRGFTDAQKEEYFRRRIDNEIHANKIVSHIKTSRTLYIMCHIPVFCWILATVLQKMLEEKQEEMPKTVTEMYIHFLFIQTNIKNQKYHGQFETNKQRLFDSHKNVILNLAKLAFKHLENGNLMFHEEDLNECGIDVSEDSVYSGMCAEILREDSVFSEEKVYCFVHLSIQEFLAALFVFHAYTTGNQEVFGPFLGNNFTYVDNNPPLIMLLSSAMEKALDSKNGHLDLFIRFLVGISVKSNQAFLQGLLPKIVDSSKTIKKMCRRIKEINMRDISPERCLNLLHCLFEMNDYSLHEEVKKYLKSPDSFSDALTPSHCSAIAQLLLMSEEVLDELDLRIYRASDEGWRRLIPVVRYCRKARLAGCYLTEKSYEIVAYALQSAKSALKELDLSHNDLQKSGEKLFSALHSPNCKLETLRLSECHLTDKAHEVLASALQSLESLRELDLSHNYLRDSGVQLLSAESSSLHHHLQILKLNQCHLSKASCEIMASVLQRAPSHLRELDISDNSLQDEGVELLCVGLRDPQCKLETLRVKQCHLSKASCKIMASVLHSTPSHLRELDMSNNDLQDEGVELLCVGLGDPQCKLETLRLSGCLITHKGCSLLASALNSNPSYLKELDLCYNHPEDHPEGVKELTELVNDPNCKLDNFRYDHGAVGRLSPRLTKYACVLTLDPKTLHRELILSRGNTQITAVFGNQPYPVYPERFELLLFRQVLCKEGLSERGYWEVEWTAEEVDIAVAYGSIPRKEIDHRFSWSDKAWTLSCFDDCYKVCHNKNQIVIPVPVSSSKRVGVYLDWPAGTLSFYSVCSDTLTHLHTFQSTFTEPLYPGFMLGYAPGKEFSMSLCQIITPKGEKQSHASVQTPPCEAEVDTKSFKI